MSHARAYSESKFRRGGMRWEDSEGEWGEQHVQAKKLFSRAFNNFIFRAVIADIFVDFSFRMPIRHIKKLKLFISFF